MWRLLLARMGAMLGVLLLANVAFGVAAQFIGPQTQAAAAPPLVHWSYEALAAAVTALITAFTLRLLLAPQTRWWRVDRSLGEGVLLLTLASLSATAAWALGHAWRRTSFDLVNELMMAIPVWWACASMMLWPVGVLLEDPEMSQARAFKQMRGNVRPYVQADLLLMLGMVLAALLVLGLPALVLHVEPKAMAHELRLPMGALFGTFAVAQTALWAALYQSRKAAIPAVNLRGLSAAPG